MRHNDFSSWGLLTLPASGYRFAAAVAELGCGAYAPDTALGTQPRDALPGIRDLGIAPGAGPS
jgi:hypothetical protein